MSTPRVCVIAASDGGGPPDRRKTAEPTSLLEVAGVPLLTRLLELARDELGIERIQLVVGDDADRIRAAYRDGRDFGVAIGYLDPGVPAVPAVPDGPGAALLAVEGHVQEPFILLRGDACWVDSNLRDLPRVEGPYVAVWAVRPGDDPEVGRGSAVVRIDGDRVAGVGDAAGGVYVGCGAWAFSPAIFPFARETPLSPRSGRLELDDVLERAVRAGADVKPFVVRGHYVELDTAADRKAASHLVRSLHFERRRVSVVVPTYNEAASIGAVLRDFGPHVWETVVVDNASPDGTADIARRLGATVISRPTRGFGDAVKQGLDAARGDILVMVEADGTFRARDLPKLLEFLKDADMVIGTRTARDMVEPGANMDGVLRVANILWGKIIEGLWWSHEARYTDVGCTYRAFWRDAWLAIRGEVTSADAGFLPELVIEMMRARRRVIEIPVNYYRRRAGESKYSGSLKQSARTGLQMLELILRRRLKRT